MGEAGARNAQRQHEITITSTGADSKVREKKTSTNEKSFQWHQCAPEDVDDQLNVIQEAPSGPWSTRNYSLLGKWSLSLW